MADSGTDDREAEIDQVEGIDPDALQEFLDSEIEFVERAPIAAVAVGGKQVGSVAVGTRLAVVCSDGAVFMRISLAGASYKWRELEPVPGTARAASWEPEE